MGYREWDSSRAERDAYRDAPDDRAYYGQEEARWYTSERRWMPPQQYFDDGWGEVSHTHGALERRSPGDLYYPGAPVRRVPARRGWVEREAAPDPPNYVGAVLATVLWYALPMLAYLTWILFLPDTPRAGCVAPDGQACAAPRTEALRNLFESIPQVTVAIGVSIVVATMLRWGTTGWRSLTVGFAGAVVGAGVTTVIFTVLTG